MNGCWTSCFTFLPADLGRVERMLGSALLTGRREELVAGLENLEAARLETARGVDDELGEHLALDVGGAKHVGVAQVAASGDLLHLLLDLELEVRLVGVDRCRTAHDALGDATGDALTREVGLVRDLLGEVDVGEHVRDLDRRGEHLEALRRRRRHHDVLAAAEALPWAVAAPPSSSSRRTRPSPAFGFSSCSFACSVP